MATFVAFTIGAGAASACLYEASLAFDQYATAANPRRYSAKGLEPIRGPSSINLSTYTDYVWSKGEHPKFTDIRSHWNNAVWTGREKVVRFVEEIKK